jgi:hypothetical protein
LHEGTVKFGILDPLEINWYTLPKLESRGNICLLQC